jgi:hypothetical protein
MNVAMGGTYVAFSSTGAIEVIDHTAGRELPRIPTPCQMSKIAVSRTGRRIVSAGECGVFVWETATGRRVARMESRGIPDAMAFSWDERHVVISGGGLRIREVLRPDNTRSLAALNSRTGPRTSHTAVALNADGGLVAAASGPDVVIRDAVSGKVIGNVHHSWRDADGNRLAIAFAEKPHYLVTADDYVARLWDVSAQPGPREVARYDLRSEEESPLGFTMISSDARIVATVTDFAYRSGRDVSHRGTARLVKWLPEDVISSICSRLSRTPGAEACPWSSQTTRGSADARGESTWKGVVVAGVY